MIFLLHKNFPRAAGDLIRHFDLDNNYVFLVEEYPDDTVAEDWVACVGKQAKGHRPIIVSIDDGVRTNSVNFVAMAKSRCTFVIFNSQWLKRDWTKFREHLVRVWPLVLEVVAEAEAEDRQCKIDVPKTGSPKRTNFS